MAIIAFSACEQHSDLEGSSPVEADSLADTDEGRPTVRKMDNGEIVKDGIININDDAQGEIFYFKEGGLSFAYPDYIGGEILLEIVEASVEDAFIVYPKHKMISFNDYLLTGTHVRPKIQIFPLDDYLAINDYNSVIIKQTKMILARENNLVNISEAPYVPQPMAAQIFYANLKFIETQAGSGLRYITKYGQDIGPVTNDYIFYTYQGISADNSQYISATFPVYHPGLPSNFEDYFNITGTDYETFEDVYTEYLEITVQMLDNAGDDDFTPALGVLDNIMADLALEW